MVIVLSCIENNCTLKNSPDGILEKFFYLNETFVRTTLCNFVEKLVPNVYKGYIPLEGESVSKIFHSRV